MVSLIKIHHDTLPLPRSEVLELSRGHYCFKRKNKFPEGGETSALLVPLAVLIERLEFAQAPVLRLPFVWRV